MKKERRIFTSYRRNDTIRSITTESSIEQQIVFGIVFFSGWWSLSSVLVSARIDMTLEMMSTPKSPIAQVAGESRLAPALESLVRYERAPLRVRLPADAEVLHRQAVGIWNRKTEEKSCGSVMRCDWLNVGEVLKRIAEDKIIGTRLWLFLTVLLVKWKEY